MFRRTRFGDLIARQLDLFERDRAGLLHDVDAAERAYTEAARDEAEERYGEYVDLVETATEALADLRDHFASTLGEDEAERYVAEFNRGVRKRLPRFGLEIDLR